MKFDAFVAYFNNNFQDELCSNGPMQRRGIALLLTQMLNTPAERAFFIDTEVTPHDGVTRLLL
jgi:hypothetical protein